MRSQRLHSVAARSLRKACGMASWRVSGSARSPGRPIHLPGWVLCAKLCAFEQNKASKKMANKKVAIVGGGIAGLTTAHVLKQRGYTVTVFEEGGFKIYVHLLIKTLEPISILEVALSTPKRRRRCAVHRSASPRPWRQGDDCSQQPVTRQGAIIFLLTAAHDSALSS